MNIYALASWELTLQEHHSLKMSCDYCVFDMQFPRVNEYEMRAEVNLSDGII